MKEEIYKILDWNLVGNYQTKQKCAEEILNLFNIKDSVCDECGDGSGYYGPDDMIYTCSKCNPKAS